MKASTKVGAFLTPNFRKFSMHEKGTGQSKEDAASQTLTAHLPLVVFNLLFSLRPPS